MATKQFVQVRDGIVVGDLSAHRTDWEGVEIPPELVEVTGHPDWKGLGSLVGATYDTRTKTFAAAQAPTPAPARDTIDARLTRIEQAIDVLVKR